MQDTEVLERVGSTNVAAFERPAEAVPVVSADDEYDISVVPNDFNVDTLCNFMGRGAIVIPIFQRDYVWNQRDASRFVESVVWGFPVPEIFVFEEGRNNWQVVDGQQRLLSLYYFRHGRFPLSKVKGSEFIPRMRREKIHLDTNTLGDDRLFADFPLDVTPPYKGAPGSLHGKTFDDLPQSIQEQMVRRPIRTVVIRQHGEKRPKALIEIFERLNTGGKNLSAQQIRDCVFQSDFLRMVNDLNNAPSWRKMVGVPLVPRRRDAEFVLRALAMLDAHGSGNKFFAPIGKFLDQFCAEMSDKPKGDEGIQFLREMFEGFMGACEGAESMFVKDERYFLPVLFEAVFVAALSECFREKRKPKGKLRPDSVSGLAGDKRFEAVSGKAVMKKGTAEERFKLAREFIRPL